MIEGLFFFPAIDAIKMKRKGSDRFGDPFDCGINGNGKDKETEKKLFELMSRMTRELGDMRKRLNAGAISLTRERIEFNRNKEGHDADTDS